jgi:hypothetical protein
MPGELETAQQPQPLSGAVLSYARPPNPRDRAVTWLVWIVFTSQLLMAFWPLSLWIDLVSSRPTLASIPMFESVHLRWLFEFISRVVGDMTLIPITRLIVAGMAYLILVRVEGALAPMRRWTWILLGLICSSCLIRGVAFLEEDPGFYRNVLFETFPGHTFSNAFTVLFDQLGAIAAHGFPLLLLLLMISPGKELRQHSRGTQIWWLTAGACLVVALPAAVVWLVDFKPQWMSVAVELAAAFHGEGWISGVVAVADLVRAAGCILVFVALAWAICRGTKPWRVVKIFSSLLVVQAAAFYGLGLLRTTAWQLHIGAPATDWLELTIFLSDFAAALAFPLAVRMALSLAEVRARLDGLAPAVASPK